MTRRDFTITGLRRCPTQGHWIARVTPAGGRTTKVDRAAGSWLVPLGEGRFKEIRPDVAAALQAKVRPLERKERIAA